MAILDSYGLQEQVATVEKKLRFFSASNGFLQILGNEKNINFDNNQCLSVLKKCGYN